MPRVPRDWLPEAAATWDYLVKVAPTRRTATYGEVSEAIGLSHWRPMRYPLGLIQEYCVTERLPVLPAIVVYKGAGVPGDGSVAAGRADIDEVHEEIFDYPWDRTANPFSHLVGGNSISVLTHMVLADPDRSGEVYGLVRNRGISQMIFRAAVSKAYGYQCAMCRLSFSSALQAAHIIPYSKASPLQRIDPRNGLLLCATHHLLFDAGYITVTEQYRVRYYDPDKKEEGYSEADSQVSAELHDRELHLPQNKALYPNLEWIRQRNDDDGWEE